MNHLSQSSFHVMGNYQRSLADGQEGCGRGVPLSQVSSVMILQMTKASPLTLIRLHACRLISLLAEVEKQYTLFIRSAFSVFHLA